MGLPEQDKVPKGPHGTETAPLGQKAHAKSNGQRNNKLGLHGPRTLDAVKKYSALILSLDLWEDQHQYKEHLQFLNHAYVL